MSKPTAPQSATFRKSGSSALVIGGGIAGLLAAHMLKDRFSEVTVLERATYVDPATSGPAARPSVPQSHCLHMLMGAGALAFDELVPGWRAELIAQGAVPFDAGADMALRVASGWLPRVGTGITLYGASRCLIEAALLALLRDAGNVRIQTGQRVIGIELAKDGARVQGVRLQPVDEVEESFLQADIVVDASGAASRLPRWLARQFGAEHQIAMTEHASGRQYVSRWVRLAPDHAPDWQGLALAPTPETGGRAGMMIRAERDLWGVVLQAPDGTALPTDDRSFLTLSAELSDPALHNVLVQAEPAGPVHLFGRTVNRRRHYEDYPNWPDNLFALGDSVCALDPYAGLGMTAAARGVQLLSHHLDRPGRQFQARLAEHNKWPWRIATDAGTGCANRLASLTKAAPFDPSLAQLLLEVQHMLRKPETLSEEAVA
ncbi:FAD-dependent monooxygenase [Ruegeria sp.]|uniref:FAD-dependent oxidoreductase n=1 Tax=Ruegeria sp. TaxID=1879320 RepID=UPI002321A7D7|nr:FAD-dependent monooxygenase [Ruegeria sp.]MDA7965160.1 FAD-dependent oxidoreductase [Ruegeria sp.]